MTPKFLWIFTPLGLIYKIDLNDDYSVDIDMTLTAPNCPAADFIVEDVRM